LKNVNCSASASLVQYLNQRLNIYTTTHKETVPNTNNDQSNNNTLNYNNNNTNNTDTNNEEIPLPMNKKARIQSSSVVESDEQPEKPKSGYCECCNVHYRDYEEVALRFVSLHNKV
jgi:hypothetical protein